jgi:CDP-paratose synthetase
MSKRTVIFMTGATGYLGSHILLQLVSCGHRVYCLKRKSSDLWRVQKVSSEVTWIDSETVDYKKFFLECQIDIILHCATDYGRKKTDPIQTVEANLILPLEMLHAAVTAGVSYFINTDTVLDKRINNYSLSKQQFVEWLEAYSDRIIGMNVALEHFYGPNDDSSKFVTYILQSLIEGVPEIQLTEGYQQRDFIYIDDVVNAFLRLVDLRGKLGTGFHRFEVASGESIEIRKFILLAKALCSNKSTYLNFGAIPYRKNEVMCSHVDTSGLRSLGWKPETSLEQGLTRTISLERKRL